MSFTFYPTENPTEPGFLWLMKTLPHVCIDSYLVKGVKLYFCSENRIKNMGELEKLSSAAINILHWRTNNGTKISLTRFALIDWMVFQSLKTAVITVKSVL